MNINCIPPALRIDKDIIETLCHSPESSHDQFYAFFRFYCNTLCADLFPSNTLTNSFTHPLASSIDVIKAISILRSQCGTSKEILIGQLFPGIPKDKQEQSLRTLVKVAFMLDTASYKSFSDDFQLRFGDTFPVNWKDDQSLVDFIQATFPPSVYRVTETHNKLKAWKLKKRHGVSIVPTNDLIQHLLYDPRSRTLTVFHQVAWLKAQLRHAAECSGMITDKEYIERGILPPRILRETLYSIYRILFPLDEKSAKFTRQLVNEQNGRFDDSLMLDPGVIHPTSEPFELAFWGKRLQRLEDVVANPPPTNTVISWIERHTSERNALTVAIAGLFFAALFGLLSVLVGVAQLILSYYAWKYPTSTFL